jgi:hypothetical protein
MILIGISIQGLALYCYCIAQIAPIRSFQKPSRRFEDEAYYTNNSSRQIRIGAFPFDYLFADFSRVVDKAGVPRHSGGRLMK